MTEIKIFYENELVNIKDEWTTLERGNDMTPFQSFEWYMRLNEQFLCNAWSKNDIAVYAVAYEDGVASIIAPLHIKKHGFCYKGIGVAKGIYILGQWGYTDYLNLIYQKFSPKSFEAIVKKVISEFKCKDFYFQQLIEHTEFEKYLKTTYSKNLNSSVTCVEICPSEDFEKYSKNLKKSTRQNIRTAFNRINKNDFLFSYTIEDNVSREKAEILFSLYCKRNASKNNAKSHNLKDLIYSKYNKIYNNKLKKRLYKSNYLISSMTDGFNTCVVTFKINDDIAGFCYGLKCGKKVSFPIVCLNDEFSWYSPCMIGLYSLIRDTRSFPEFSVIDLTRGTEKYKYDLGGQEKKIQYYSIKYGDEKL